MTASAREVVGTPILLRTGSDRPPNIQQSASGTSGDVRSDVPECSGLTGLTFATHLPGPQRELHGGELERPRE